MDPPDGYPIYGGLTPAPELSRYRGRITGDRTPTSKRLRPPAQGRPLLRATLGTGQNRSSNANGVVSAGRSRPCHGTQPRWGWTEWQRLPGVASRARQPRAEGPNPLGILHASPLPPIEGIAGQGETDYRQSMGSIPALPGSSHSIRILPTRGSPLSLPPGPTLTRKHRTTSRESRSDDGRLPGGSPPGPLLLPHSRRGATPESYHPIPCIPLRPSLRDE